MAIIWADFPSGQQGLYGNSIGFVDDGIWTVVNEATLASGSITLVADPDPNIGNAGVVLRTKGGASDGTCGLRISNPSGALATVGIASRLWLPGLPPTDTVAPVWQFRTASNTNIATIHVGADGRMIARLGSITGTILGQSNPVVVPNAYNHIEIKMLRHASAGTIEVRVNGVVVLALDTLALGATDTTIYALGANLGAGTPGNPYYFKDVVLWDGSGVQGNDFQGSVAVHDLYTDGDIDLNWTPSTGTTGWDLIDEIPPVDTDYIQAGDPAPDPAKFSLTDLPEDVTSVRALIPIARAVKTDGGDCNLQVGLTPNDTNWDDGADRPLTTAYTYWWDVSHLSPATSAPWTPAEVNDAYVRVDRTL